MATICGEVQRIVFAKEDSGWTVFSFREEDGDTITVVGIFPDLAAGASLEIIGEWANHPTFGKQFKAKQYNLRLPTSDLGVRKYLEWALPNIGSYRAKQIVDLFGSETFKVIEETPDALLEIQGINRDRLEIIKKEWREGEAKREAYVFLARFGLTKTLVDKVIDHFRDWTVSKVSEDPYVLMEVAGLSFHKVDHVALNMGIAPNSAVRRRAALLYVLQESCRRGHVYQPLPKLCRHLKELKLPQMDRNAWSVEEATEHLRDLEKSSFVVRDEDRIYLRSLYFYEVYSSYRLLEMVKSPVGTGHILRVLENMDSSSKAGFAAGERQIQKNVSDRDVERFLAQDPSLWFEEDYTEEITLEDDPEDGLVTSAHAFRDAPEGQLFHDADIEQFLQQYQEDHQIELSDAQKRAIYLANKNRAFLLTGLPGTGKTTVLKAVLALYEKATLRVQLCAPTGKAAKRLEQVTNRQASTIHRYLGGGSGGAGVWKFHEQNNVHEHAVIVDEYSMVDTHLLYRLLAALGPSKYFVMVGDPGQLPSVGPGSVLKDLISSGKIPRVHLEEIFRQSAQSAIILNAHNIHKGKDIDASLGSDFSVFRRRGASESVGFLKEVCSKLKQKGVEFQVITPKRKDSVGTTVLNQELRPLLNDGSTWKPNVEWSKSKFYLDDKVIVTKNDYEKMVFNGDIGTVTQVDPKKKRLWVNFGEVSLGGLSDIEFQGEALDNLELAYALTVHKSQGSEWDTVVLLMVNGHGPLLKRRLLYTAVTRAKKQLFIIGEGSALSKAVNNNVDDRRNTSLSTFLRKDPDDLEKILDDLYAYSYSE